MSSSTRSPSASNEMVQVTLGKRYAGAIVRVEEVGELVHAYLGDELIRVPAPDRTKRCQKLGKRETRGSSEQTCRT